ncbi:DUF72 domain-containing protein [Fodinibius sediminis]|nr:DUF72 domain-containing protein [Fodinibius sediminis]
MADRKRSLHIGTSGWSYKHWTASFYPQRIKAADMLNFYSRQFDTVEVNSTFYRLPTRKVLLKWKKSVPDHFLFSVKASRYITHQKKLKDPAKSIHMFISRIQYLGPKLGPILFQLPPHWLKNRQRLSDFIGMLPGDYRYVFEFRDASWFADDIIHLLEETGSTFCIYDLEGHSSPKPATAEIIYLRFHSPAPEYEGDYSRAILKGWVADLQQWRMEGKEVFCYFNNDFGGYAPRNARLLGELAKAE